jgi:hypothetical protein
MSAPRAVAYYSASYVISSWVKTHNMLGRIYMLPVAPVHRLLVSLMMRGVPM